jgi:tetratricopeptide (TPR) repeat protein/O-antigen ligase
VTEVRNRKKRRKQGRQVDPGAQSKAPVSKPAVWPERLGETAIIAIVIAVPLAMNPKSMKIADVKEVALALGVSLGLALWLLTSLARGRLRWATSRLNLLVAAYALWAGVSILYSSYRYATVSEFGRLAAHVALYGLAIASLGSLAQVRRVITAAAAVSIPVCIYALLQATGHDPIPWETQSVRVFSFLGNPTFLASFASFILPLSVAAGWPGTWCERTTGAERPTSASRAGSVFFFAVAAMAALCLYLSISLSPVIGFGLGGAVALALVVIPAIRRSRSALRVIVPATALGLIVLAAMGSLAYQRLPASQKKRVQKVIHFQDPYGRERGLHWQVALAAFRAHPLLGRGFGTFRIYSLQSMAPRWYTDRNLSADTMLVPGYAHNEYLQVLADTGAIGGVLFLAMLVGFYAAVLRVSLASRDDAWRRLGLAITVGATAFFFQNFFGVTFRQTGAVTLFWLSLALVTVATGWQPGRPDAAASGAGAGSQAAHRPQPAGSRLAGAPRVRELRFKPLSAIALAGVGLGLCILVGAIGWLAMRPAAANMKIQRGKALARAGRVREAAAVADEAVRLAPYSAVAHFFSAYTWGRLGEMQASPEAARGYLEKSLKSNEKALALLPGNAYAYYNMGVLCTNLGRFEEAEHNLRRAIELMPSVAKPQAGMAKLLLRQGKAAQAFPYAQEAVRLEPNDPRCRVLLADAEVGRGDLSQALANLQVATNVAPGNAEAWQRTARVLLQLKRYGEALSAADECIRLDPNDALAYNVRGVVYFQQQSYAGAAAAFRHAVELSPGYRRARLNLALSYNRLGENQSAQSQLERLVRSAPDTPEGRAAQAMLSKLRQPASGP